MGQCFITRRGIKPVITGTKTPSVESSTMTIPEIIGCNNVVVLLMPPSTMTLTSASIIALYCVNGELRITHTNGSTTYYGGLFGGQNVYDKTTGTVQDPGYSYKFIVATYYYLAW